MSNIKYPLVMFKVEIILAGNKTGRTMFCLGLNDVHKFTDSQRIIVGKEDYNGYRSQAIPLSRYTESVIKKGVETLDV